MAKASVAQGTIAPSLPQSQSATVVVRVSGSDGGPFQDSADVMLSPEAGMSGMHEFTRDAGQATFNGVTPGTYYVVVTAAGYKPGRDQVDVGGIGAEFETWVQLVPEGTDSQGVTSLSGTVLAPKVQKELARGVEALRAGKLDDARKLFESVYKAAPGSPDANYFLGYTFLQQKSFADAENFLLRSVSLDPKYTSAYISMGDLRLAQGRLPDAVTALEKAISLDSENFTAHWTLAAVDLKQRDYEKARTEAEAAVSSGKGAANGAEFIIGESWVAQGDKGNAIAAFESFLKDAPHNSSAPAAQALIAKLKAEQDTEKNGQEIQALAKAALLKPEPAASHTRLPDASPLPADSAALSNADMNLALPSWAPRGVDESKPAVDPKAVCALPQVLEKTGANVKKLVANIGNIDATEQLVHEQLNEVGKPVQTVKRHYDYLANINENSPGSLSMTELRDGNGSPKVFPGDIATSGLISMALVFHPLLRDDFQMTCEGRGDWRGRAAWIVYFRQRDGRPGRVSGWDVNGHLHRLNLKGRAWITADSFQIVHLETDLVKPMPEIQLMFEHISATYVPVRFHASNDSVWLPSSADLYFEFRKQRLHRRDTFTHYKLFSVADSPKINQPPPDSTQN